VTQNELNAPLIAVFHRCSPNLPPGDVVSNRFSGNLKYFRPPYTPRNTFGGEPTA